MSSRIPIRKHKSLLAAVMLFGPTLSLAVPTYDINSDAAPGALVYSGFNGYVLTPPGNRLHHYFPSMNDSGAIVGRIAYTYTTDYGNTRSGYKATLWQNDTATDLGVKSCRLSSSFSECSSNALTISNGGDIFGTTNSENNDWLFAQPPSVYDRHPAKFDGSGGSVFVRASGWEFGWVSDVNANGDLVGADRSNYQYEGRWGDYEPHGYVLEGGTTFAEIGLYGDRSYANAINNAGQVTGTAHFPDSGVSEAFVWTSAQHHQTPTRIMAAGTASEGFDINNAGHIVGVMTVSNVSKAFLWNGGVVDLGTLGGVSSTARSINDAGLIVGYAATASEGNHAFIYESGSLYDLNDLVSLPAGWVLVDAYKINNNGQVLVRAQKDGSNAADSNAYWLLSPSTEAVRQFKVIEDAAEGAWVTTTFNHGQGQTIYGSAIDPYGYYTTDFPKMNDFNEVASRVTTYLATYPRTRGNAGEGAIWYGENRKDGSGKRVMKSLGVVYCRDVNNDGVADNSFCGSRALDINNDGIIVGSSHDVGLFGSYPEKSYYFKDDRWWRESMGYFSGQSYLVDINEQGSMTGSGIQNLDYLAHGGVALSSGHRGYIGEQDSQVTYSHAINEHDHTTGQASFEGNHHAFHWHDDGTTNGALTDLGTLGGAFSIGYDITNQDVIVGLSADANGDGRAFKWTSTGGMVSLGTLGGGYSVARSINEAGQIVGYSTTAENDPHAYIYENGQMTDLNTLVPDSTGWEIVDAYHINEYGEVLVRGKRGTENKYLILTKDGIVKCRGCDADTDSDGDGVKDVNDAFVYNANESVDSDGDGYGNNRDAEPNDPTQWDKDSGDLTFSFAHTFGNRHANRTNADLVYDVHVDASGNVYQAGSFRRETDFSGMGIEEKNSGTWNDGYVVKTNADGSFDWSWTTLGYNQSKITRVTSTSDSVLVLGQNLGTVQVGDESITGTGQGVFLAKLDLDGNLIWVREFDGPNHDYASAVAQDSAGNIYVAMHTDSLTLDVDPSANTVELERLANFWDGWVSYTDLVVVKLNASGEYVWNYHIGENSSSVAVNDLVIDGANGIYVSGQYHGNVDFNAGAGDATRSSTAKDGFVLKLNTNGAYQWSWVANDAGDSSVGRMAALVSGVVLSQSDDTAHHIATMSASGVQSTKLSSAASINDIEVDSVGNVYVAGSFAGLDVDLNGGAGVLQLTSAGDEDAYVSKYSSGFAHAWTKIYGGSATDSVVAMDMNGDGNLYVTGQFSESVDLDPGLGENRRYAQGHEDVYLMLLSSTPDLLRDSDNDGLSDALENAMGLNPNDASDATGDPDGDGIMSFAEFKLGLSPTNSDSDGDGIDDKFELDTIGLDPLDAADAALDNDRDGETNLAEYLAGTDINVAGVNNYTWTHVLGTSSYNYEKVYDAHADADGNVYQVGKIYRTMDMSSGLEVDSRYSNYARGFVVKTAPNGEHRWSYIVDSTYYSDVQDVTSDSSGNIYISGYYRGNAPFAGVTTYSSYNGIYVIKLDSEGQVLWGQVIDGTGSNEYGYNVALDAMGNIYISGYFYSTTVDFDPSAGVDERTRQGNPDMVVTRFNADGSYAWTHQIAGVSASATPKALAIGGDGQLYAAGVFRGTVDFKPAGGGRQLTSAGGDDIFVTKLDVATGNEVWTWQVGSSNNDVINDMVAHGDGVSVAGRYSLTVDFDPLGTGNSQTSPTAYSGYVAHLASNGSLAGMADIALMGHPTAIAYDAAGNFYLTGSYSYTVDFNPTEIVDERTSNGGNDVFVTKYYADGFYAWTQTFGGTSNDSAVDLAVSPDGLIYVTGSFYGTADFNPTDGVDSRTSAGYDDIFLTLLSEDPALRDTDGDHLTDQVEAEIGLNPQVWDTTNDNDGDGLNNYAEYKLGTNLNLVDTDGDLIDDKFEAEDENLDPLDPTDASQDYDRDGLTNYDEYLRGTDMYVGQVNNFMWVETYGSAGSSERFEGLHVDVAGNSYQVGYYNSGSPLVIPTATGDITLPSTAGDYVIKRSPEGDVLWARAGHSTYRSMNKVTTDAAGNVYVSGFHHVRNSGRGFIVTKYDADGNELWVVNPSAPYYYGYNYTGRTVDIEVTSTGEIFVAGYDYNSSRAILVKMAADGSTLWSQLYGTKQINSLALDAQDNLYIGGYFYNTEQFDLVGLTDEKTALTTGASSYVTRLNSDGSYAWTWTTADSQVTRLQGRQDGVDVLGKFSNTVDFDVLGVGRTETAPVSNAGYLASVGNNGVLLDVWVLDRASPGNFAIDSQGNTYFSFGSTLRKHFFDDRSVAWTLTYPISIVEMGVAGDDSVFLSGNFSGTDVDFDPTYRFAKRSSNSNSTDGVVIKLNSGDARYMQDSDHDGLGDVFETENGLNALDARDAALDLDNDGLTNLEEEALGTGIRDLDSDGDGLHDGFEVQIADLGFNPTVASDGAADYDGDGISNAVELNAGGDPILAEADSQGWYRVYKGLTTGTFYNMTSDAAGNVYFLVYNTDVDPGMGVQEARYTALVKMSPTGEVLWEVSANPADDMEVDANGNIYMVRTSGSYGYIYKYNSSGVLQWSKSTYRIYPRGLALDNAGNPVVVGNYYYSGNLFGTYLPTINYYAPVVYRLDSAGNLQESWYADAFSDVVDTTTYHAYTYTGDIQVDSNNNVYLTGVFTGGLDFANNGGVGDYAFRNRSVRTAFVTKLTPGVNDLSEPVYQHVHTVVIDNVDNNSGKENILALDEARNAVYVAGNFRYAVDFNGVPTGGEFDVGNSYTTYLLKLDMALNFQSVGINEDLTHTYVQRMVTDAAGNVYVAGEQDYASVIDLDPTAGVDEIADLPGALNFVYKVDANGVYQGKYIMNNDYAGYMQVRGLTVTPDGSVYMGGHFKRNADLDMQATKGLVNAVSQDGYLRKITPAGFQ